MFKGVLHTHVLLVTLFLLLYMTKTILLLANRHQALSNLGRLLRVPEMVITSLFFLSGIYLWVYSGNISWWFYAKLAAVFLSIPIAIVAFRKQKKGMALAAILLILYAYGVSETKSPYFKKPKAEVPVMDVNEESYDPLTHGEQIYESLCASCHGKDGSLGLSGAKLLNASVMSDQETQEIILKGKGVMPGFKNLSAQELSALQQYLKTLKE